MHVSGLATVVLIKGDQRLSVPGEVPPGDYEVEATLPNASPIRPGTLHASAGVDMQILCSEAIGGCRIRPY